MCRKGPVVQARPASSKWWFPSPRSWAAVVAWAIVVCVTLQVARPEIAAADAAEENDGSSERHKRRQERRRRLFENIIKGNWHGADLQEPVAVVVPLEIGEEFVEALPLGNRSPLPERLRGVEFPFCAPLLAEEARLWSPSLTMVDSVLTLPDQVVNLFAAALNQIRPNDGGILDRLMNFGVENNRASLVGEYFTRLYEREQRYFARFEETTLADTYDNEDLLDDQRKLIWDALRRTYQSRYRLKSETLSDDAFEFEGWRGIDLVVVPPLMAGYVMYRGLDRSFSVFGTRLKISVEPYVEWKDDDLPAGLGFEWGPKNWPVAFIVTAGLEDGKFKGDFVGIGTSVGMVRRLLTLEDEDEAKRRIRER